MGFEQYREPANELPQETRTFARIIVSLTEEAEAIDWYEQRLAVEKDASASDSWGILLRRMHSADLSLLAQRGG